MEYKSKPKQPVRSFLFVLPSLIAVILFYTWFVSAGNRNHSGTTTIYYAYLAEAFLNGDLHLAIEPEPELLNLDDPYELSARMALKKRGIVTPTDFSLYEGKFYLYWGPVPALILAIFQIFSGEPIADLFFAFIFGVGMFLVQSTLLITIWDGYFASLPKWTLQLAIVLGGSLWPVALLRHYDDYARIYEAAIAGGQFFLMSGLFMAFTAISKPSLPNWRLVFAGSLWVLAIGTRHVLAAPIGLMSMLTALWLLRLTTSPIERIAKLISLGVPLALGGAALAWYNWARFGSIVETGFSYALAEGVELRGHSTELFSGSYVIPNLYNYLFNPPALLSKFPFVSMLAGKEDSLLPFYAVPEFYYAQRITGLLCIFPFALFGVVLMSGLFLKLFKGTTGKLLFEGPSHNKQLTWLTLMLSASFLIAFSLLMVFFWAGTRYVGDFIPAMIVLSVLGFWQGYQFLGHRPMAKNLYILAGIILSCVSVLMSTLLAISIDPVLVDLIIESFPFQK